MIRRCLPSLVRLRGHSSTRVQVCAYVHERGARRAGAAVSAARRAGGTLRTTSDRGQRSVGVARRAGGTLRTASDRGQRSVGVARRAGGTLRTANDRGQRSVGVGGSRRRGDPGVCVECVWREVCGVWRMLGGSRMMRPPAHTSRAEPACGPPSRRSYLTALRPRRLPARHPRACACAAQPCAVPVCHCALPDAVHPCSALPRPPPRTGAANASN